MVLPFLKSTLTRYRTIDNTSVCLTHAMWDERPYYVTCQHLSQLHQGTYSSMPTTLILLQYPFHLWFSWYMLGFFVIMSVFYHQIQQVRWDENIVSDRQERVSPWEIDVSVSLPPLSMQSSPRLKKLRTSLQETPPENPVSGTYFKIPKLEFILLNFPYFTLHNHNFVARL